MPKRHSNHRVGFCAHSLLRKSEAPRRSTKNCLRRISQNYRGLILGNSQPIRLLSEVVVPWQMLRLQIGHVFNLNDMVPYGVVLSSITWWLLVSYSVIIWEQRPLFLVTEHIMCMYTQGHHLFSPQLPLDEAIAIIWAVILIGTHGRPIALAYPRPSMSLNSNSPNRGQKSPFQIQNIWETYYGWLWCDAMHGAIYLQFLPKPQITDRRCVSPWPSCLKIWLHVQFLHASWFACVRSRERLEF